MLGKGNKIRLFSALFSFRLQLLVKMVGIDEVVTSFKMITLCFKQRYPPSAASFLFNHTVLPGCGVAQQEYYYTLLSSIFCSKISEAPLYIFHFQQWSWLLTNFGHCLRSLLSSKVVQRLLDQHFHPPSANAHPAPSSHIDHAAAQGQSPIPAGWKPMDGEPPPVQRCVYIIRHPDPP